MLKYRKILVGLNFLPNDIDIIKYAGFISRIMDVDKITFVHVLVTDDIPRGMKGAFDEAMKRGAGFEKKRMYDTVKENIDVSSKTEMEFLLKTGNVVDEMVKTIKEQEIDLLVLGRRVKAVSHRRIVENITSKTTCSVLLVPDECEPSVKNILVPVDFSDYSREAIEEAVHMATKLKLDEIRAAHIYRVPSGYHKIGKTYEQFAEIMHDNSVEAFDEFIEECDTAGVMVNPVFRLNDDPTDGLDIVMRDVEPDFVVMGSKGKTDAAVILLGSTVENAIWNTEVPILIVKKKGENMGLFRALFGLD